MKKKTLHQPTQPEEQPKQAHAPRSTKKLVGVGIMSTLCGIGVAAAITLGLYATFLQKYEFRFYPGVHVGSIDLSGLTYLEGLDRVAQTVATLQNDGIAVHYAAVENATVNITPTVVPLESSGNDRQLFVINYEESVKQAYAIGRNGSVPENAREQWSTYFNGYTQQPTTLFYTDSIQSVLQEAFSQHETPAVNADITIARDGSLTISDEQSGSVFDYDTLTTTIVTRIRNLETTPLFLYTKTALPTITRTDIQKDADTIEQYLQATPVTLTWEGKQWSFDRQTVGSWLSYSSGTLRVDSAKLATSLIDANKTITIDVKESRWAVDTDSDGRLTGLHEMQTATTGQSIDTQKTGEAIFSALQQQQAAPTVALIIGTVEPKFTPDNIADLGIRDLLGTGHSNMGASPRNRRLNIARGVELLNGLLIAPGEQFSLLNALKPFTLENGYFPELVIKGNKTTPEVGGGLCQIGTTTFRGAMNSGLPILKRQNHSYAVSYYADDRNHQPGTDATIYDPAPDFSFANDTGGYLLLQTRIEGDDLYFDFWGTSDGRVGSFTAPVTSNWIQPPPLKEVPTTDLAPGERKCTEVAHAGVTADFTYSVTFADGTKKDQQFHSVYKPWQAVCLVGVAPGGETTAE